MMTIKTAKKALDNIRAKVDANKADFMRADADIKTITRNFTEGKLTREEWETKHDEKDAERAKLAAEGEVLNVALNYARDNYNRAIIDTVIPVFVRVWNTRAGKQYGTKTRDAITAEVGAETGAHVCVYPMSYSTASEIYLSFEGNSFTIQVYGTPTTPLILVNNQIQTIPAEAVEHLRPYNVPRGYTENPIKAARAVLKKAAKVKAAEGAFLKEYAALNEELPLKLKMEHKTAARYRFTR